MGKKNLKLKGGRTTFKFRTRPVVVVGDSSRTSTVRTRPVVDDPSRTSTVRVSSSRSGYNTVSIIIIILLLALFLSFLFKEKKKVVI